jgi:hypothetical protein
MNYCAIMQPTFIPWAGYFSLIANSQSFVFLDDVQLEKQSWQTRNRLLISGKTAWSSVPVYQRKLSQLIQETEIDDRNPWRHKLQKTIEMNYGRSAHFSELRSTLDLLQNEELKTLSQLNIAIVRDLVEKLELKTDVKISSELPTKSPDRSQRLIDLCQHMGSSHYLSPTGAEAYLLEDGFEKNQKVQLSIFEFHPSAYPQPKQAECISHLSFIDVLAHLGLKQFRAYILNPESVVIRKAKAHS